MKKISAVQERLDFIIPVIKKFKKKPSIIDLGCGTGILSKEIYKRLRIKVKGIDLDKQNIEIARKNCPENEYLCIDINKLKKNEKVDIIILSEVLEHLENPKIILASIKNRLNKNGIVIATIPNGYGPWELLENQPLEIIRDFLEHRPSMQKKYYKIRDKLGLGADDSKNSNKGSRHVQRFTITQAKKLFFKSGYWISEEKNTIFLSSLLPLRILRKNAAFIYRFDRSLSKIIPNWMASGWGFVLSINSKVKR